MAKNFVAALKAIGRLSGSFAKTVAGITKNIVRLTKRLNVFSRMAETLGGAVKQLGSTIKSALVFSVIYKGLSLLREQVGSYLMVNEQFSTALRRLQGVLLTAFQPIYDMVVPALTTLVNALTHAIAVLAQFFAGLFGTTAKKAQTNAKALYGEATALKATGKAAEEAAGSLAGFDEINQIQTEDKSGSGGGSSTPDTGAIFDYSYEETPFASWGEIFNAFLDDLLEGIPKLEAAFRRFADGLNGWAQKVYDMFTFPGVLDKVKKLGEDLANALNGLVDAIEWELLGQALGAGLNLALNFLTSLLYGFDWINLGRSLAAFVNGLVSEIDWYEFGRLLWAGFKIGLETLAGFILGLDMPLLAEAASSIVNGFFDEMYNTISTIPWMGIGTQIAAFLNGIDWYGTITSVLTAIQAAVIALSSLVLRFIEGLEWEAIAKQIYTAINDSMDRVDWTGVGWVIGEAFTHTFDFVRDVVSGINWYEIGQNIADLIIGFDFASALGSLADALAAGINAAIQLARGLLDRLGPEAQGIAEGIAERLRNAVESVEWDALGGVIGDGVKTALSFVAGLLDPELFSEIGKAIGDFLVNLDWPGLVGGLAEVIANGIASAVAAIQGFMSAVQPNLQQIAEDIAAKINEFVETVDWAELGQTIHDGIDAALDFLITILDNLDWEAIGDAVVDFLANLNWGTLLNKWGTVVGKAVGGALKGIDLTEATALGGSIVGGMLGGMLNKWIRRHPRLDQAEAVLSLCGGLLQHFRDSLPVHRHGGAGRLYHRRPVQGHRGFLEEHHGLLRPEAGGAEKEPVRHLEEHQDHSGGKVEGDQGFHPWKNLGFHPRERQEKIRRDSQEGQRRLGQREKGFPRQVERDQDFPRQLLGSDQEGRRGEIPQYQGHDHPDDGRPEKPRLEVHRRDGGERHRQRPPDHLEHPDRLGPGCEERYRGRPQRGEQQQGRRLWRFRPLRRFRRPGPRGGPGSAGYLHLRGPGPGAWRGDPA